MTREPRGEGSSCPAPCGTFFQSEIPRDRHDLVQGDIVPGNGHPPVCVQEETEGRKESEDRGPVVVPQAHRGSLGVLALSPWFLGLCSRLSAHGAHQRLLGHQS